LRIVYIEDRARDAQIYKEILSREKTIKVISIEPSPSLEVQTIVSMNPDLILVDYKLTGRLPSGGHVSYQGGTLATRLREELRDYPFILFSRREIVKRYWPMEELGAIDEIIYKEDVDKNPDEGIRKLLSLAKGFAVLRNISEKSWKNLIEALCTTPSEADLLRESSPPFVTARARKKNIVWSVRQAASWILKTLFEFPGILYDSLYASASLGIDENSFLKRSVQGCFKEARFDGPFHEVALRWWRGRLHEEAFRLIRKAGLRPVLAESFGPALRKVMKIHVKPSICVYSGEEYADSVCYILGQPVKRKYTLEYYPDKRPASMDIARVSYKAIREDNRVQDELFNSSAQKLLRDIRR